MRATHKAYVGRKPVRRATLSVGLTVAGCVLTVPAAAAAPPTYDYVVTGEVHETHEATGTDGEAGLCSTPETARYDGTFTFRLRSTVAGLSDADVLAVRESEPDGTVRRARYESAGRLVLRSGAHTYTMRYTGQDTAQAHGDRVTFASRFTALGHSETGTRYSILQAGRLVLVGGAPLLDRERLVVRGCLP